MTSRNSRSEKPKRARTGASTMTAAKDEEVGVPSESLTSSAVGSAKGKQLAIPFNFLQDLPADILGEITSYLASVDLLHLAWTTKDLGGFLLSASSAIFWKRARQNDESLPPCPDDLAEPAYARLLFSDFCHKCLSDDRDVLLHLEARTQLCESCTLEEFARWKELPEVVDDALSELVPATSQQLTATEKKQAQTSGAEYRRVARTRFHIKPLWHCKQNIRRFSGLRRPHGSRSKRRSGRLLNRFAHSTSTSMTALDIANAALIFGVHQHAEKCRTYIYQQRWKEHNRVQQAKGARIKQIHRKLNRRGYGNAFENRSKCSEQEAPSSKKMNHIIYQEHELTDDEWGRIQPDMLTWMQEVSTTLAQHAELDRMRRRIETSLGPSYSAIVMMQPTGAAIPTLAELALMGEFAPVLESTLSREDIPEGALDSVIARIPELVESWKTSFEESLLDLLGQSSAYTGRDDLTSRVLSYASTLFTCTRCVCVLTYPSILAHRCFIKAMGKVDRRSIAPHTRIIKSSRSLAKDSQVNHASGDVVRRAFAHMRVPYHIWHPGSLLEFNEPMHYHTVALLDLLGMERTITASAFFNRNPYVEGTCKCFRPSTCKGSNRPAAERKVTRWSQALLECRRHRSRDYTSSFTVVDEADVQGLAGYVVASPLTRYRERCLWCGTIMLHSMWHLTRVHGLSPADATTYCQIAPHELKDRDYTVRIGR